MSSALDSRFLSLALRLARRGYGLTSPNPMVGAVLVKRGEIIGRGWHRRAGEPHAEIEAIRDAQKRGHHPKGATLYVTLEPCSTHGRTPPCTEAIVAAGIKRVVAGTTDPNPKHRGKAFAILKQAGIEASTIQPERRAPALPCACAELNAPFNHWIVQRTPLVTVKAAMTLDGKIATAKGESKWITGPESRAAGMKLREGADAILVGVNTILADNPALTFRSRNKPSRLRRIVLDSMARTPLTANVVTDEYASLTTIVISTSAPRARARALAKHVKVIVAPAPRSKINSDKSRASSDKSRASSDKSRAGSDKSRAGNQKSKIPLPWLLRRLGAENVTHLLVEGGGEVNASFLLGGFAQRIAFFYAPKILGGRDSLKAVAGEGAPTLDEVLQLRDLEWHRLGHDLLLTAKL